MAHECPTCGQTCYCNGDIDDCCFADRKAEANCVHCMCRDCGCEEEDCVCPCPVCDEPMLHCLCGEEYP